MDSPAVPEGRVGRARGEYGGMFVQVERDPTASGWHVWLSDADPRDGPAPAGADVWDMWADDEQDVWEVLGPECLDVDWMEGEAAAPAVSELLSSTGVDWYVQRVSAAGIEGWLHDADIALGEVELVGRVAVVPGMSESLPTLRSQRGRGSRTRGRSPFLLLIDPAEETEVDDEQRIDQLIVGEVRYAPSSRMLAITSPIPGQVVRVRTDAAQYYLASSREPTLVRSWGRWRPVADPRPDDTGLMVTAEGPGGTACYVGPPQVNPSPGRKWLRRMGLPEPHETIETYLAGLSAVRRHQLTAELVSTLAGGDAAASLHRAGARGRGWHEASQGPDAVAQFLESSDTDDWWAGDVALFVRGGRGPAVFFPSSDGDVLVVVAGGYRCRRVRAEIAHLVAEEVSETDP